MAKKLTPAAEGDEVELQEDVREDDVALSPGPNADKQDEVDRYISANIRARYEVHSYRHAASILANSYPEALADLEKALNAFKITTVEIGTPGGNESEMPKKFARVLRPTWFETRIQGDLIVRQKRTTEDLIEGKLKKRRLPDGEAAKIENFIDGHKIDFVFGRVAFDVEWNSKDQTFDRDLYALRAFHECGLINVGVIVTRGNSMNRMLANISRRDRTGAIDLDKAGNPISVKSKYGASTTWMGKLLYRLNAGRHGGCPVLALGMKPAVVTDWKEP